MEKLEGMSLDLTKLNIEKLKELFPMIDVDGKIDFDMLRTILGDEVDDSREKYQFTWNGKTDSIRLAQSPSSATLRPCKKESKDWDTTENLYIEGDNLEVLKQLQKTYYGKVKMIYIDPPYNTGNDFIYKDDFKNSIKNYKEQTEQGMSSNPETNGRYHTDWLNMMYPRLVLARNLLCDDGVIFISIDDNELHNLKKICDEIFGATSFLNQFAWVSNITGRQISGKGAAKTWETVLVYTKNIDLSKSFNVAVNFAKSKMPDAYKGFNKDIREDDLGKFAIGDTLYNHNRKFNEETRPNLVFSIFYNIETGEILPGELGEIKPGFIEIPPHKNGDGVHKYHAWRWSREKVINESYNLIVLPTSRGGYEIYTRIRDFNTTLLKDIITNISNGDAEVQKLFDGKKYFDYPKSINLIRIFTESISDKDSIVLDFFSGSATTAHAVMKLNSEDNGNRKFIMVQIPEDTDNKSSAYKAGYKNICEIGKERIRRAGELIKQEYQKSNPDKEFTTDIGFKVFKLDSTNIKPWENTNKLDIEQLSYLEEVFKKDRNKEDILYEILLKYGLFDMSVSEVDINGKTMYRVGRRYMLVCLEDNINASDIKKIIELSPRVVVFKETGFNNDNDKINAEYNLKKAGIEEIKCI